MPWRTRLAGGLAGACLMLFGPRAPAAGELGVAMPYACTIERGEPRLEPAGERTYRLHGGYERREIWVCAETQRGPCDRLTLHRFEFLCDGQRVAWIDAAPSAAHGLPWRMSLARGQVSLRGGNARGARDGGALKLPKGFAPPPGGGFRIVTLGEAPSDGEARRGHPVEPIRVAVKRLVRRAPQRPPSPIEPEAVPQTFDLAGLSLLPMPLPDAVLEPPRPEPAPPPPPEPAGPVPAPPADLEGSLSSATISSPPALSFTSDGFAAASAAKPKPPERSLAGTLALAAVLISVLAMIGRQRAQRKFGVPQMALQEQSEAPSPSPAAGAAAGLRTPPPPPPAVRLRTLTDAPSELQITHQPIETEAPAVAVTPEAIDELQQETQAMLVIVRQMVHDHVLDPNLRALLSADVEHVAFRLDDPGLIAQLAAGRLDDVLPVYGEAIRDLERARALARVEHERTARLANGDGGAVSSADEAFAFLGINPSAGDAVAKKVVDALRQSWHPDLARSDTDRAIRDERMKRINAAWDLIRSRTA